VRPQQFVWDTLRRLTPRGATVVDVGCGPSLYRGAVDGRYVGVDLTDEPYADDLPRDVDVIAPADNIPLPDAFADLLFTLSAFHQMGDPARLLAEFRRLLRPGGQLLIFDYNRRTRRYLSQESDQSYLPWTQWRLCHEVRKAGFRQARLLAPVSHEPGRIERVARLIHQELMGQWAIVSAVR